MFEELGYAGMLRPIGQLLEGLRIEFFTLSLDDDGIVVRDKTRNRTQLTPREKAFLSELKLAHADSNDKRSALRLAAGILEWRLTEADIERLEQVGREHRRSSKQTPDSHSTSQILRVIGGMIDQKRGRLLSVTKEAQLVTVEFTSSDGRKTAEEYTLAALYDFWVRMYKKRGGNKSSRV